MSKVLYLHETFTDFVARYGIYIPDVTAGYRSFSGLII